MKLLWLSHLVPYPPRSGVAQRSLGLLRELAKRHEISLLAFHQPELMRAMSDDPEDALVEAEQELGKICADVRIFEIPWDRSRLRRYTLALTSLVRPHPFSVNWLESKAYSDALQKEKGRGSELVHFDTISLAIFRRHIDWAPCVLNHHNIESHLLLRRAQKTASPFAKAYYYQEGARLQRYEHRTSKDFALHVTCSELDRQRLLGHCPGIESCVIPNGVDVQYFDYVPDRRMRPHFAFVGTLGWGPNKDAAEWLAASLWPALAREWPDARFHLIGSNPPEIARELASRDDRFLVTGFVEDVRPYLEESPFFLCPIRDGGGTKLKILNAMATGSAVVADPVALEGIDATPDKEVAVARTPEEYVGAIRRLMSDQAAYRRRTGAARSLIVERYSYAVIGRELDRQYAAVRQASAAASG